jgi:small subunit ribosomal protein S6
MKGNATVTPYETLFVIHPDRVTRAKEFIDKFKKVVEGLGGTFSQVEEWGLRDLAYRIDKQSKGFYVLLQYRSSARAVEELERNMRLTDGILRYLTVRAEEQGSTSESPGARSASKEPPAGGGEGVSEPEPRP